MWGIQAPGGLGRAHTAHHQPPAALRRRESEQGMEPLVGEAGGQRGRVQAEERRSGIEEPHPPAAGTSALLLQPSSPHVPESSRAPSQPAVPDTGTVTKLSWPSPPPERGSKPAHEAKSRRPALQNTICLLAGLPKCIQGKKHPSL